MIIKRSYKEECKPVGTPFVVNFKFLKLSDEEFMTMQREMEGVLYKAEVSHVCNGGHEGCYCIWCKFGESIHVTGQSTTLDGSKTHHEVLERYFGLQIMPWRQGYCPKRFLQYAMGSRYKQFAIHHGVRICC